MNHEIQTAQLSLAQMSEADRDGFESLLNNSEVIRYCFDPLSSEMVHASFESRIAEWAVGSEHWLCLSIFEKTSGAFVGTTGFRACDEGEAIEVGFLLLPEFYGKGYATESLKAVLDYARDLGFVRALAYVTEGNEASCRVLEKCGFQLAHIDKASVSIGGALYNDLVFKLALA